MEKEITTIFSALAVYCAVVLSPGPNFTLITRLAASGDRTSALGATLGFSIGAILYAILSMTGLALVITRVGWFVTFIQIAGGSYLIYLGLAAWITCQGKVIDVANAPRMTKSIGGFRTGIIVELSNPKGIAFFVSFFAVAVPIETELWAKGAVLIGGFLLEVLWYGTVAHLFSTRPIQVLYQKYANWIERITGTLLAGFGISMIVEKI